MKFWQLSLLDALSKVIENIFFSIPHSSNKLKILSDKAEQWSMEHSEKDWSEDLRIERTKKRILKKRE